MEKKNVIIAGSTGMIGESVLDRCIKNTFIENILIINRRPSGFLHPRVKEVVVSDMSDIYGVEEELKYYDACLFCIGVSSIGMKEEKFKLLTYDLTINFAKSLAAINSDMTFCYISGAGTDSSENGKVMWARVKGKTENDLMKLPFRKVYNFRPAGLIPYLKVKPNQTYQSVKYFKWLMVLLRPLFPKSFIKMERFADAMINSVLVGYSQNIVETSDILVLAQNKPA